MLYIHATNVHAGGGRVLLNALLESLPTGLPVIAQLDERMTLAERLSSSLSVRRVAPTVWQRLTSERWLARNAQAGDAVLCFGNLPPLFQLRGRVFVFVQNRYLIEQSSLRSFGWRARLRLRLERFLFSAGAQHVSSYIVQSPSMERMLSKRLPSEMGSVQVWPFVADSTGYRRKIDPTAVDSGKRASTRWDFVYVASGEPHKNHRRLVEAWVLLAEQGHFPSLALTLDPHADPVLCDWISTRSKEWGLQIEILGAISRDAVLSLYRNSGALVFPSLLESFGLPLIEARQVGLAVLASEFDYVRDVLDPEESFDPLSPVSMARAVGRFLGAPSQELPLMNAQEFLQKILEAGK
jgi:glycosyltransferase involved in cell wall biosynthesis